MLLFHMWLPDGLVVSFSGVLREWGKSMNMAIQVFGYDTWHHTQENLNLLEHCCEKSNLSHSIRLKYACLSLSILFTVNIISLIVETSSTLTTKVYETRALLTLAHVNDHMLAVISWHQCLWASYILPSLSVTELTIILLFQLMHDIRKYSVHILASVPKFVCLCIK
jgi:hypothetical protein